jgi:hypothetical protein
MTRCTIKHSTMVIGKVTGRFKSAPAAVSWGRGHIDVFGIGTDDAVWQQYYGDNK